MSENSDRFRLVVGPLLPEVDMFFANDLEAERLTGVALRPGGAIVAGKVERAAKDILALGVRQWVILHFPEAAFALAADGEAIWEPSLRVPKDAIAGAAGAGDAFASGVLYGRHHDWGMRDALRFAACVAASSLTEATCSDGVRSAAECRRWEELWGLGPLPV